MFWKTLSPEDRLKKYSMKALETYMEIVKARNMHYDTEETLLSGLLTMIFLHVTRDGLQRNVIGVTTAIGFTRMDGLPVTTCAALNSMPRELCLMLSSAALRHWANCYWQGSWGVGGEQSYSPASILVAGEDIQAGDPIELIGDKVYTHHGVKK